MDASLFLRWLTSSLISSSCGDRIHRSISWNISCSLQRKKFRSSGSRVASSTSSHVAIASSCLLKATFIDIDTTLWRCVGVEAEGGLVVAVELGE